MAWDVCKRFDSCSCSLYVAAAAAAAAAAGAAEEEPAEHAAARNLARNARIACVVGCVRRVCPCVRVSRACVRANLNSPFETVKLDAETKEQGVRSVLALLELRSFTKLR